MNLKDQNTSGQYPSLGNQPESEKALDRNLLQLLKPHWRLMLGASICSMLVSATSLSLPVLARYLYVALNGKHERLLLEICTGVVALFAFRWPLLYGQTVLFAEVGQRVGQSLRLKIFTHLQTLSLSYFDNQRTGNLISTFSNDVPLVQGGILSLKDIIGSLVLAIGGLVCVWFISWKLSLVSLILLPVMGYLINTVSKKIRSIAFQTQNTLGGVTTVTEESLSAARVVRAFGAEQREISRFAAAVQAAKDLTMTGIRRSALLGPTTDLLGAAGMAIALWVGGMEVIHKSFTTGGLIEFCYMLDRIRLGIGGIGNIGLTWRQTLGAGERIFGGVLDVPASVADASDAVPLKLTQGEVEFKNVSFGYFEDQIVLSDVSFTMRPGEVTAIVGPSGAGKSTLADLIPRFYDPTHGSIGIDGQDTKSATIKSLRDQIAIVPQETMIFGGTVRENIAYGMPDASEIHVEEAARAANAHEFIQRLQHGYDTVVGERGVMLSGGQRQRIAIARAVLKNPRILILDEATSSLDETSQILVQEALEKLMDGRTTLVIAHRLSTIKNANKIVVLKAGEIVESGSHSELILAGGEYAALYETQFRNDDVVQEAISHVV